MSRPTGAAVYHSCRQPTSCRHRSTSSAELGLSASEVAKALGYSPANATNLLKRLEQLEHVVRVPGERPARWRRTTVTGG